MPNATEAALDRFMAKVDVGANCWIWTAHAAPNGYGRFWHDRGLRTAHRWIWEAVVGPIPEGLVLDHLCRVRNCVNPDHLEPVTEGENILRGFAPTSLNARKTFCIRGHDFSAENTILRPNGKRACRTCSRAPVKQGSAA